MISGNFSNLSGPQLLYSFSLTQMASCGKKMRVWVGGVEGRDSRFSYSALRGDNKRLDEVWEEKTLLIIRKLCIVVNQSTDPDTQCSNPHPAIHFSAASTLGKFLGDSMPLFPHLQSEILVGLLWGSREVIGMNSITHACVLWVRITLWSEPAMIKVMLGPLTSTCTTGLCSPVPNAHQNIVLTLRSHTSPPRWRSTYISSQDMTHFMQPFHGRGPVPCQACRNDLACTMTIRFLHSRAEWDKQWLTGEWGWGVFKSPGLVRLEQWSLLKGSFCPTFCFHSNSFPKCLQKHALGPAGERGGCNDREPGSLRTMIASRCPSTFRAAVT